MARANRIGWTMAPPAMAMMSNTMPRMSSIRSPPRARVWWSYFSPNQAFPAPDPLQTGSMAPGVEHRRADPHHREDRAQRAQGVVGLAARHGDQPPAGDDERHRVARERARAEVEHLRTLVADAAHRADRVAAAAAQRDEQRERDEQRAHEQGLAGSEADPRRGDGGGRDGEHAGQ